MGKAPRKQLANNKRTRHSKRNKKKLETDGGGGEYTEIVKECPAFESYYKEQGIVPTSEEWSSLMTTLREPLPVTFRITGSRSWAQNVLTCLEKKYFSELEGLEVDGEKISPPRPLVWYPDNLAWHVSLSRSVIRSCPLLTNFHSFLVKESNQGNISRQEAVSMIPPLLLGVEPHHYVLDMCAAPGSKTTQLIEALHAGDTSQSTIPKGVVIANDIDNSRCYMLVHQAKRLNSPCLIVTNHQGTEYPVLYHHDESGDRHRLDYDRILCDVPCSGDGTLRKNPTIWRSWNPGQSLSLHRTQLQLLIRGLELLKPGGDLVYSTCSLNPIENEAVVSTAVKICKGSVELTDCSELLPGLIRVPGMNTWKVMTKDSQWVTSRDEAPPTLQSSMFPPTQEEAESFNLERCIRILPHHQNTGGFFVAKFHKLNQLPWQQTDTPTSSKLEEKPHEILGQPSITKRNKRSVYREDPYVFLPDTDALVKDIVSYYHISDEFPKNQFLSRTHTGKRKTLYLSSPLVQEITKRNEKDIRIINTGVRVFARCENIVNTIYRLTQEGINTMIPYITNCYINVTLADLLILLKEPNPLTTSLSSQTQQEVDKFGTMRPVVIACSPTDSEKEKAGVSLECPIYLSGWIAALSLRLYLSHPDRYHFLAILGETPPEVLSLETQGPNDPLIEEKGEEKEIEEEEKGEEEEMEQEEIEEKSKEEEGEKGEEKGEKDEVHVEEGKSNRKHSLEEKELDEREEKRRKQETPEKDHPAKEIETINEKEETVHIHENV